MIIQLRQKFLFSFLFLLGCFAQSARAQGITLPASGTYTETFDNLGSGLPAGWTVRTGATASPPNLGTEVSLNTTPSAWNEATAGFKNVASAEGLSQTATPSEQAANADRALGVRQTGDFGDPGAAFMLQIANTTGVSNLNLKFKIQSLDAAASRTTIWRVEYGLGQTPQIYFQVGSSFTTGGNTFSNVEIPVGLPNLSNNSGPVRIRIVASSPSSGSGEQPTTAIDDVTLTYVTTPDVRVSTLNTLTYGLGNGSATQDFSIEGKYLTGPQAMTATSNSPSVFSVSSDGVNFGPYVVIPYAGDRSVSTTIKIRLTAGLSVGAYRSLLSVRVSGLNYGYFLSGLVTQTNNQPVIGTSTSLAGTNGFKYNVGGGPIIKTVDLFGANLMGVPGSLTLTSSNPTAFRLVDNNNVRASATTINYDSPSPGVQFQSIVLVEGLAAGQYAGMVVIAGGGAQPVTIPLSGTVTTDNPSGSLAISPAALAAFSTTQGMPSALQSFTITGRNFDANNQLQITIPSGFEGALFNSNIYSPNPTLLLGSGNFDVPVAIRMTGRTSGLFSGDIVSKVGASSVTLPVTGTVNPVGTQPLSVTAASYNCQTGVVTFGRLGGDPNRAVEYEAIGVKSYSTNPVGVIEQEKRNDSNSGTTVTLKARYVGDPTSEVSYVFDFGAYCSGTPTPTPTGLRLIEPLYNCQTGAITFRAQGGDGTPIEYGSIGVKQFSTDPNGTIEAEKRGDPNSGTTVELKARQAGVEVSYVFDFAAYCRSGRQAAPNERANTLQLNMLGNPVSDELTVEISGVAGKPLELRLSDVRGAVLEQRNLTVPTHSVRQTFNIRNQRAGLLFLQAVAGEQRQTVKVVKP